MAAFRTLHKRRRYTEAGPEPIGILEIEGYARIVGLGTEATLRLLEILGELDDVLFKHLAAKKPKPEEPKVTP